MQVFEGYPQMYQFEKLPEYIKYVRDHCLLEYVKETLLLSRKLKLPLMKFLDNWCDEQLIGYSKITSFEFLTYLVENRAKQEIEDSLSKWLKDQLEVIGKFELSAEDLTLIIYIRSKALKKFITDFTSDASTALKLVEELDTFNLGEITSATNTYINILKDKIDEEVYFNEKLASTSPGMIYVFDRVSTKLIYANKKVNDLLGFNSQERNNRDDNFLEALMPPENLLPSQHHFESLDTIKDEEVYSFEHQLKDAAGTYRWIRNYETVFKRNEEGKPVQIIGTAYDISEEKRISEDLKFRKEQLTEAQALAQLGSFEWDIRTDTTTNSDQYYKIFEYSDRKRFDYFMSHVQPDDKEKLRTAFEKAFRTGHFECEFRFQTTNGKEKYIWSKGVVLFDKEEPVKMMGTVQDITDRRRIEETLLQKTIELQKTNADLVEFTYVASHDLKEPLRKIATFSDIILTKEQQNLSDTGKLHFQKIIDSCKRMQKMIDDILALSSVVTTHAKEPCNLQSILEDVLQLLEHFIQQKEASITSDQLPTIHVIPSLFRQLFLNLLSNALKFSKKDVAPQIAITHTYLDAKKVITFNEQKACYVAIKIQDNGIGFSNESSEKIFSLFQRLHGKNDYEGNGLGLAICKKIVEEHNGTITAASEPNVGATFTITIPVNS